MLRRITSLTGFLSFIVLAVSSVVLFIEPHGRVAYWTDWTFLGLTKTGWDDMHIAVGTLFLICAIIHTWLNWSAILLYLKNKARQMVVATPPMVIACVITAYVTIGAIFGLPPMQQLIDLSESIKTMQAETWGNPPYAHAELSPLPEFCQMMDLGLDETLAALEAGGIAVGPVDGALGGQEARSLRDIARFNHTTPAALFIIIRDHLSQAGDAFSLMPPNPPEGSGMMPLAALASQYGLPPQAVLDRLAAAGVESTLDQNIKQIAQNAGLHPRDVYALIRTGRTQ